MPLSTPSTSSPHCVVNNLDIAVVDDATSPLFARASPVRLSYSAVHANKRTASSTRAEDSLSSPPKNRCDTRASLLSRRHGIVTAASYPTVLDIFGDDLVAATPRPSPPSVGVVLSADQLRRLEKILDTIKKKPLSNRRAILHVSRSKAKSPPKKAPVKKVSMSTTVKQKNSPKLKKTILTSILLTKDIRLLIFGGEHKKVNYSYDKEGMKEFDSSFQKQLKFRFDERQQQRRGDGGGGGVTTGAAYDLDVAAEDNEIRTTNFDELYRYVLDDILACKEDTLLLLCIKTSLNAQKEGILTDGTRQQRELGIAGDVCKISGE